MRFAVVATGFATLLLACGTTETKTTGTSPLLLQAFGGPSGQVAAQVPLVEAGVGLQQTCMAPVVAGACQFTSCQGDGVGSPGFGGGNFGPISASVASTTVPIPYNGAGYPTVYFPSSVTLVTGGTMRFHGDGGTTVPSFDASVTIPGLGVITSPVPTTAGGPTIIDTAHDLTVTWTPISIGEIEFALSSGSPGASETVVSIACTFAGSPGSGMVSQTLLSSLKAMGTGACYGSLSSELQATTVVDDLEIVTQGFQNSGSASGQFSVTLQ